MQSDDQAMMLKKSQLKMTESQLHSVDHGMADNVRSPGNIDPMLPNLGKKINNSTQSAVTRQVTARMANQVHSGQNFANSTHSAAAITDDRETMRPVEFMQKSLKIMNQRMQIIEDQISNIKQIIEVQPDQIKGNIKTVTRDFVE